MVSSYRKNGFEYILIIVILCALDPVSQKKWEKFCGGYTF